MRSISVALAGLAATLALAAPMEKRQNGNIDVTVLQFALTLEHLENKFYADALKKFKSSDFQAIGLDSAYYSNLQYISSDEQNHVTFLSTALSGAGVTPVQPCTYNFPYTDAKSFVTLSSVLEGVGTSAYLGGAPLITSKDYLTAAGSILVTEAIHTSTQRRAIGEQPSANPYGTPLDPTSVFTLASQFIVSCPPSNPSLGFTPYPVLTLKPATTSSNGWNQWQKGGSPAPVTISAGSTITLTGKTNIPSGSYLTFVSGLTVVSVPANSNKGEVSGQVPSGVSGQTYVFATKSNVSGKLDASQIIAGPAIVEIAPPPPSMSKV